MSTLPFGGRPVSRPASGAVRMRRALVLAGCGVLSVGLSACESTEQESARIGRENEAAARTAARPAAKHHRAVRGHGHAGASAHGKPSKGAGSR